MKRFLYIFTILVVTGFSLWQVGCNFNPFASDDGAETSISTVPAGNANVGFKIVLPDKKTGGIIPLAAIRPATQGKAKVTVVLVLADPGNKAKPKEVLTKTVEVNASNAAEATFDNVPTKPVVGQVRIDNGHIAGYSDFHGAIDLESGDNICNRSVGIF